VIRIAKEAETGTKPNKALSELSDTLRKFFANMLKIKYQFTYDELNQELFNHNLDWKFRAQIDKFFKKLTEMEFGGREVSDEEIEEIAREAQSIIRRLSGYTEERPQSRASSWANRSLLDRLKKATGIGAIASRRRSRSSRRTAAEKGGRAEHPATGDLGPVPQPEKEDRAEGKPRTKAAKTEEAEKPATARPTEPKPEPPPAHAEPEELSVDGITRNVNGFVGKKVKLSGTIKFVNKIIEKGDFWYMFSDSTGNIVAVSKLTDTYEGKGVLKGLVKKTLTGDAFIEIEGFR